MKKKKVWLWIATVFVIAWGFTSPFALVAAALIFPVEKWQEFLARYIKKPLKIAIIVISLVVAMFFTMITSEPASDTDTDIPSSSVTQSVSSEESSEESVSSEEASSEEVSSEETESSTPATSSQASSQPTSNKVSSETPVVAPPVHTHSFSEATCTAAAKCSCGETGNAALGHNYVEGSCSRCNAADPNYSAGTNYVLNINPKVKENKFHRPSCSFLPEGANRKDVVATREEIIQQGYVACKKCNP